MLSRYIHTRTCLCTCRHCYWNTRRAIRPFNYILWTIHLFFLYNLYILDTRARAKKAFSPTGGTPMAKLSGPKGNRTPIRSTSSTPISKIPVRSIPGTLILSLWEHSWSWRQDPYEEHPRHSCLQDACEKHPRHSCLCDKAATWNCLVQSVSNMKNINDTNSLSF